MGTLSGKVALVTGASRGVGKGIALSLGQQGATVIVTGRTVTENQTVPLPGTLQQTAAAVTERGGRGVAIPCDHRDDAQVRAVFERVQAQYGRLDILVNNAWAGYEGYATNTYPPPTHPFWERPLTFWDENLAGLRWAYVATVLTAPLMIAQGSGLIVNIAYGALEPGNVAYNIAKSGAGRLAQDAAHQLREHNVAVVALHPGLVRTELVLALAQFFDMSNSESPEYTGRAVVALAADPHLMQRTGQTLCVARLAQEYDFDDVDGKRPTAIEGN